MSFRVAVIEDDDNAFNTLKTQLETYGKEISLPMEISWFKDGVSFLENYHPDYDAVFMDIGLPEMNGLEVARKMREKDTKVILIFITDLAQYAIKGYEVNAYDFVVKPVVYPRLKQKMDKVLALLKEKDQDKKFSIKSKDGFVTFPYSSIRYVEIMNHHLEFHTTEEDYEAYGSLNEVEKKLSTHYFVRCNNCYLVNLSYVTKIDRYWVYLDEDRLQISHPKRKAFLEAFTRFLGEQS